MTNLKTSMEKRFKKLKLCKCPNGNFCFDTAFTIKQFIKEELKKEREKGWKDCESAMKEVDTIIHDSAGTCPFCKKKLISKVNRQLP